MLGLTHRICNRTGIVPALHANLTIVTFADETPRDLEAGLLPLAGHRGLACDTMALVSASIICTTADVTGFAQRAEQFTIGGKVTGGSIQTAIAALGTRTADGIVPLPLPQPQESTMLVRATLHPLSGDLRIHHLNL